MATDNNRCGCGAWTGEACAWVGPTDEMVVVERMPEHLRGSHQAAGNRGAWPANGAIRVAVERSCAALLLEDDSEREWATIIDADPAQYLDTDEETTA